MAGKYIHTKRIQKKTTEKKKEEPTVQQTGAAECSVIKLSYFMENSFVAVVVVVSSSPA